MMTRRNTKATPHSRSTYIAQTEQQIINCHYLAADLLDLSHSVPFVEPGPVRLLSASLTRWADQTTLIIEDIRRIVDDSML
jgi:hypothetical protein